MSAQFPKDGAMPKKLLLNLTSRSAIMVMNIVIILLMLQGSWDILRKFSAIAQNQPGMENILQGLSTILVAFGLVLQERAALLAFLKLYPHGISPHQSRVDTHCSGYGLAVILAGMFVSVAVYLIRMPDLDIVNFDPALIVLGALFCLAAAGLLARLSWLLWRDPKEI
ncbi:MAG: hypothetical protein CVU73_09705 [Deltaproteobacteria bacterium HGW-Deltaproteobacteria-8]|jgi:hypothetical protein|nr:MAG: hypothetical protein CVU73_09705 [Deltaproteobacteria bacterium HGW-Deltaproteobacteria-8]